LTRCLDSLHPRQSRGARIAPRSPRPPLKMTANNIQLINIGVSLILVVMTFLFIFRIVLTWYPQVESQKLPFSLVIAPTEPFLAPSRKLIPPIGGVDITPIVWVGIVSLIREVLVGQQGIITMLAK
jgi:YggT family protein